VGLTVLVKVLNLIIVVAKQVMLLKIVALKL
jgi:hypothetical protein